MTYQTRTTAPHPPVARSNSALNPVLEQLLRRKDVWRGRAVEGAMEVVRTGYGPLDERLQGGGWPVGGLIDVSQANNGHGEWHLFGPALARLSQQAGLILLVNPPALPYGPGLAQLGINHAAIRVVRCRERLAALSALVDTLHAQCCLAVMAWEGNFNWRYPELRKLQLAANHCQGLCLCLRKDRPGRVQSPAPLRLRGQLTDQGLQVQLLKQRGQYQPQVCTLPMPSLWAPNHADLLGHVQPASTSLSQDRALAKVLSFKRITQRAPVAPSPSQPGGQ